MLIVNDSVSLANTELQKAKEEEKQVSTMKLSFEKQLQSERTLKVQVGVIYSPDFLSTDLFHKHYLNLYYNSLHVYWSHRAFHLWTNNNSDLLRFRLKPIQLKWPVWKKKHSLITITTQSLKKIIFDNAGLWFPPLKLN